MDLKPSGVATMKDWQNKLWGKTKELYRDERSGIHLIEINSHGFSSQHYHTNLTNCFYLLEGKLEIVVYDGKNSEVVVLEPNDYFCVANQVWHRFINLEKFSKCLEIYYTPEHQSNDIVRAKDLNPLADNGGSNATQFAALYGFETLYQRRDYDY